MKKDVSTSQAEAIEKGKAASVKKNGKVTAQEVEEVQEAKDLDTAKKYQKDHPYDPAWDGES